MIIHENDFLKPYGIVIRGVIEVGAHYAEEYPGLVNGGVENFIFFEPVKSSYVKMRDLLPRTKNIKVFNMALGNYSGMVTMYTETVHQGKSNSILKPFLHKMEYPDIVFDDYESVLIDKLDNIKFNRSLYNMLQTDTQGYDLEVLKGATRTLKKMDFIKAEVYRKELYEGAAFVEEIDAFLTEFERIYTYWMGAWGDAYYVRKK